MPSTARRTLLELSGIVLFSAAATVLVAAAVPSAPASYAQNGPVPSFPIWDVDCSTLSTSVRDNDGQRSLISYLPYNLTFTSEWVIDQRAPSTGHLKLAGVGERNTKVVARIVSMREQEAWASEIAQKGWSASSPEAIALAATKGSVTVREADDRGNVVFRFGWWMFAPQDRQLELHMKGCKSTSNYDADRTFLSLTYPNAAVTITNAERVQTMCTACQVSQLFDCEHVEITPVLLNQANMAVLDEEDGVIDPIRTNGNPLVTPPALDATQFDTLAKIKDAAKGVFDESNLERYDIHPDQRLANSGAVNGAGVIGYFMGPGVTQQMATSPDASYRLAGASIVANFADYFSVPENQTRRVQDGSRGYIVQPATFSDFSADVRLTCQGGTGASCGITQNGQVIMNIDRTGSVLNPLQLLLFVGKNADDLNADGRVNALDKPELLVTEGPCKADAAKCAYTVSGKADARLNGATVHLYSGGESPRYATKTASIVNGGYAFTGVFPGVWLVKVDQDTATRPCRVAELVLVGVKDDQTGWKIESPAALTGPDLDGEEGCWSPRSAR